MVLLQCSCLLTLHCFLRELQEAGVALQKVNSRVRHFGMVFVFLVVKATLAVLGWYCRLPAASDGRKQQAADVCVGALPPCDLLLGGGRDSCRFGRLGCCPRRHPRHHQAAPLALQPSPPPSPSLPALPPPSSSRARLSLAAPLPSSLSPWPPLRSLLPSDRRLRPCSAHAVGARRPPPSAPLVARHTTATDGNSARRASFRSRA